MTVFSRVVRRYESGQSAGSELPFAWALGFDHFADVMQVDLVERQSYGSSMIEFIERDLGANLWDKQREIVQSVEDNELTAVASCRSIGKSFIAARIAIAWLHTHTRSVVITTAPTYRQVRHVLWREIRSAYDHSPTDLMGRPLTDRLEISADWYAMGFSAESTAAADQWAGFHAENILIIVDEAASVSERVFEGLDSMLASGNAHMLTIGNPTSSSGRYHESFHGARTYWNTIKVSADDTPNFHMGRKYDDGNTVEFHVPDDLPRPYLLKPGWVNQQIAQKGMASPFVQSNIFAEFPLQGTNKLIALNWIETAQHRSTYDDTPADPLIDMPDGIVPVYRPWIIGMDVARFGDDENVVTVRHGQEVVGMYEWTGLDLMQSVGKLRNVMSLYDHIERWDDIRIDTIGLGAGIADRMREFGYHVTDISVSVQASDPDVWPSFRHEAWWQLRERFREGRIFAKQLKTGQSAITNKAVGQLSDVEYGFKSKYTGYIIEDKDEMKKRSGTSPDHAESLMIAFCNPPMTAAPGAFATGGTVSSWGNAQNRPSKRSGRMSVKQDIRARYERLTTTDL